MKKHQPSAASSVAKISAHVLIFIFAMMLLTACTPVIHSFMEGPDTDEINSLTASPSEAAIYDAILKTMYNNEQVCYLSVASKSDISIDKWLLHFPGIKSVHCEYQTGAEGYQVTAALEYWDNYPIVNAFRTGNTELLNERQYELYRRYCEILHSQTSVARTDIQNELAIHNYLVNNIDYVLDENAAYPAYDALIRGEAACSGYAEAFQTFMDMLNIKCVPVFGPTDRGEHIWNMVCLDDEWYNVDVTWDDPVNGDGNVHYEYFNITDNDIAADHSAVNSHPAALGTRYAYYNVLNYPLFATQDELNSYIALQIRTRAAACSYRTTSADLNLRTAIENAGQSMTYQVSQSTRPSYTTYRVSFAYR